MRTQPVYSNANLIGFQCQALLGPAPGVDGVRLVRRRCILSPDLNRLVSLAGNQTTNTITNIQTNIQTTLVNAMETHSAQTNAPSTQIESHGEYTRLRIQRPCTTITTTATATTATTTYC